MRALLVLFVLVLCAVAPPGARAAPAAPQVSAAPAAIAAGSSTVWTVSYTAGPGGLGAGAGLKVRLPFGFNPVTADAALSAYTSQAGVAAAVTAVLDVDPALPWQYARRSPVVEARTAGTLAAGERLTIQFGRAGALYDAPQTALAAEVLVALDAAGDGRYQTLDPLPVLRTTPLPPHSARLIAPSQALIGQPMPLRLALLDTFGNVSWPADTAVTLSASDSAFTPQGALAGRPPAETAWLLQGTWGTAGTGRAAAEIRAGGQTFRAWSNPVRVSAAAPPLGIYWGDPHSHGVMSHDAYGHDTFGYARDVSGLDFYARTDHSSADLGIIDGLTDAEWAATKAEVIAYNDPGRFATILAYEYSANQPSGHYNVYFDAADADLAALPLFRRGQYADVLTLWGLLRGLPPGTSAFTVPHHTGICWGPRACSAVTFSPPFRDAALRPALEIVSTHGQSELYDPAHGLSYENSAPRTSSAPGPHYARDAWARGERLGVLGGSDDHHGQPGKGALTAVFAPELTRTAVLAAMRAGRTYAVSGGQRILLDLSVNGRPLGDTVLLPPGAPALVRVEVTGTAPLAEVELLAWDYAAGTYSAAGRPQFTVARRWEPGRTHLAARFHSTAVPGEGLYYLRLRQEGLVHGREVWAWSSPIWIRRDTGPRRVYLPLLR